MALAQKKISANGMALVNCYRQEKVMPFFGVCHIAYTN